MMLSLLHHCLACGVGMAIVLLGYGVTDRRRGLPVGWGLRQRLPTASLMLAALVAWDMLPMGWHLPMGAGVGVLCMILLFRQAGRST